MSKRPHVYHRPDNLVAALKLLGQPNMVPLAGGTKLLAGDVTSAVVDLQELDLNQIAWEADRLRVGATVSLNGLAQELAQREAGATPAALLRQTIRLAGPNTYRNAATLGGTVASRLPDSELLAALLTLEAVLTLQANEVVIISLTAYLSSADRPPGLITEISIPWNEGRGACRRVARTPVDSPIVSVSLWQPSNEPPRLAACGITERPIRLGEVEAILAQGMSESSIAEAAAAARATTSHPGDFRGTTAYRAEMAAVLTRRVCQAVILPAGE